VTVERVRLATLDAAEPSRWPGYRAWVVDLALANGARIERERLIMPTELHARIRGEAMARVTAVPPRPTPDDGPTLAALSRVPWRARGALLWRFLADHPAPSAAVLSAVRPLIAEGGCQCRSHYAAYVIAHPPDYGSAWRRWVWAFHNAVNRRRQVPELPWEEAERRHAVADRLASCTVITLERTPDRTTDFYRRLPPDWPYRLPRVRYGVDGHITNAPAGYTAGAGAYGCRQSWVAELDDMIASSDHRPRLVMEDDCDWTAPMEDLVAFVAAVPSDAELAAPGGQRLRGRDTPVVPGVARAGGLHRTHCLIVYPQYAPVLREAWAKHNGHIDHYLTDQSPKRRYYVADPLLCRQVPGYSEVRRDATDHRNWQGHTPLKPDDRAGRYGIAHPLRCGGTKRFVDVAERGGFNGTAVVTPHGRLMVYRADDGYTLRWLYLTDELRPRTDRPRGSFDLTRNDDPRLFWHSGELYMLTSHWWGRWSSGQMELRRVTLGTDGAPKLTDVAKWMDKSPPLWSGYKKPAFEKNWQPLSHDGTLYLIYSVNPHRLLKVDLAKGTATLAHETSRPSLPWPIPGDVRLSAPPVRLPDGSYLSTLHTRLGKDYSTGFYRFRGEPPFDVLEVSGEPVLWPGDSDEVCWRNGNMRLLFPTGMEMDGDRVTLWGGDNDHSVVRLDVSLATATNGLVAVKQT
jgi:hypothetical protein